PQAHARLADEYLKHNRLAEAYGEFREALAIDRDNPEAMRGMAAIASRVDQKSTSLAIAQKAAKEKPDSPETLNTRGIAPAQSGKLEDAAKTFEQALAHDPKNPTLLLNAAAAHARQKEWKQAEERCREAIALDPKAMTPRELLAAIFGAQGKVDRAAAELER